MHSTIYQPREDSYLLQKTLTTFLKSQPKSINILDIGSGSGIQALTCKKLRFKNITAVDINPEAIKHLKKQNLKTIKSNLFNNINKNQKFRLIIFNPPYLPEDKREPKDSQLQTTGGKKGYEIIIRFLKEADKHLSDKGVILLLFSSQSKPKIILNQAKKMNYRIRKLNEQPFFFEKLLVYQLTK